MARRRFIELRLENGSEVWLRPEEVAAIWFDGKVGQARLVLRGGKEFVIEHSEKARIAIEAAIDPSL
jgi:hypothetical protein